MLFRQEFNLVLQFVGRVLVTHTVPFQHAVGRIPIDSQRGGKLMVRKLALPIEFNQARLLCRLIEIVEPSSKRRLNVMR